MRVYFFVSWLSRGNLCKNSHVCNCIQIMLFLRRAVVVVVFANEVWTAAEIPLPLLLHPLKISYTICISTYLVFLSAKNLIL